MWILILWKCREKTNNKNVRSYSLEKIFFNLIVILNACNWGANLIEWSWLTLFAYALKGTDFINRFNLKK